LCGLQESTDHLFFSCVVSSSVGVSLEMLWLGISFPFVLKICLTFAEGCLTNKLNITFSSLVAAYGAYGWLETTLFLEIMWCAHLTLEYIVQSLLCRNGRSWTMRRLNGG
jgi:hypothetical protein